MLKLVKSRKNHSVSYIQNLEYVIRTPTNTLLNCIYLYIDFFNSYGWILTIGRRKKQSLQFFLQQSLASICLHYTCDYLPIYSLSF